VTAIGGLVMLLLRGHSILSMHRAVQSGNARRAISFTRVPTAWHPELGRRVEFMRTPATAADPRS
jgi:hypothetical protein